MNEGEIERNIEEMGHLALEAAVDELVAASRSRLLNADKSVVPTRLVMRLMDVRAGQRLVRGT